MFSYVSTTQCDDNSPTNEQNVSDLFTLLASSCCLTPRPESSIVSRVGLCLQDTESPKQRDQCWALLVQIIKCSPQKITPALRSQLPNLALRDVRVSSPCVSAIVCLLENFVQSDISFAATLLPALVHVEPSANLVRVIRSFSTPQHNQQVRLQVLHNIQALVTSPRWQGHLAHLRPLLATHSYSEKFVAHLLDAPEPCFVLPFLFRITSDPHLSSLIQNLLTVLLDRLSTLPSTDDEPFRESSFFHYISTLAVTFRFGASQLSNASTPNLQKKRRVESVAGGLPQTLVVQKLFLTLGNLISRIPPTSVNLTLIKYVALCIRLMLRHCFSTIESHVPCLLGALIDALPRSHKSYHGAFREILMDLITSYSKSGRLSVIFTHLRSKSGSETFQSYAETIICTPQVSHHLAKTVVNLQLEEVGQCLKALMPNSEYFKTTSALPFLRLACLIIESLMKGSSNDITKYMKHTCAVLLRNKGSPDKHASWYFLSSLLIYSTRVNTFDFSNLVSFLNRKMFSGAGRSEMLGLATESHGEAGGNVAHQNESAASLRELLRYLEGLSVEKLRSVDIVCFMRLSSVAFQILLGITRNNRSLLISLAPDLLKKILHSYRELCARSRDMSADGEHTPLWDGSAIDNASRMIILLLGPVDNYLVEGEFDDVFKLVFQNLINRDGVKVKWEELMNKQCLTRGAWLSIEETVENLGCSEIACGSGCNSLNLVSALDCLLPFFDDKIMGRLRPKLSLIKEKVVCEESKSIVCRLSPKSEVITKNRIADNSNQEHPPVDPNEWSGVYLKIQPIVWRIFKLLIESHTWALEREKWSQVNGEHSESCRQRVGSGTRDDSTVKLEEHDVSAIVQAALEREIPHTLLQGSKDRVEKAVVVMFEVFAGTGTGIQKIVSESQLKSESLKNLCLCNCCMQCKGSGSSMFAAKLLTACAVYSFGVEDYGKEVEGFVVPGNSKDAELFANYVDRWIGMVTAGQMWNKYESGKMLALCHAIVSTAENWRLDGDMQVNTACHMLRVVCQITAVPNGTKMKMCSEAVQALEPTLRRLCKSGVGENVARPCEKSWRSFAGALSEVVKIGINRAQVDGRKCSFDGKYGQRMAATLLNLSMALLQYGVGGRWFAMDLCCAAMRYACATGGQKCNDAIGNALLTVERCRQHRMMSNERIARLIMVGAEAGASEKTVGAIGSMLPKLPGEVVSHLLRQASPQARNVLHAAQQRYLDEWQT